jgi:hypothetical protein
MVSLLSLGACQDENTLYEQPESKSFLDECRNFYDLQMGEIYSSTDVKVEQQVPKRNPKWEDAAVMPLSMGDGLVAPLNYDEYNFVRTTINPYDMPMEDASYLMMYKDNGGNMHGEIVFLLPDGQKAETKDRQKQEFYGTIIVQDLKGNIIKGYTHHQDGSITGLIPTNSDMASAVSNLTKSVNCFTFEIWQIVSMDGGQTWSPPRLLSSRTECFISYDEPCWSTGDGGGGSGSYEDYSAGGGGSGTTPPPPTDRTLTFTERDTLNQIKSKISADCAIGKVVSSVWNGMGFAVDGSITTPAQWDRTTNTITFQNSNQINPENVMEELFHAYQNTVYPGGTGKYSKGKPGNTNIEFEAKLFRDIYTALYGGGWSGCFDFPYSIMDQYQKWVCTISEGFNPELMGQYGVMLGYFNQYSHGYGGFLLSNLNTPTAILQAKSGCR